MKWRSPETASWQFGARERWPTGPLIESCVVPCSASHSFMTPAASADRTLRLSDITNTSDTALRCSCDSQVRHAIVTYTRLRYLYSLQWYNSYRVLTTFPRYAVAYRITSKFSAFTRQLNLAYRIFKIYYFTVTFSVRCKIQHRRLLIGLSS